MKQKRWREVGREKEWMEVERKYLTSYPATNSHLMTLFLQYCTATDTQRNDKTDQTHLKPVCYFFTYYGKVPCGARSCSQESVSCSTSSLASDLVSCFSTEDKTGEGRGRDRRFSLKESNCDLAKMARTCWLFSASSCLLLDLYNICCRLCTAYCLEL